MNNAAGSDLHLEAGGTRLRITPDRTAVLGRGLDCDLPLPHTEVSRRHAVFRHTPSGWIIEDLGSSNGTFLDGRPVAEPTPLQGGSTVHLGGRNGPAVRIGLTPSAPVGDSNTNAMTWVEGRTGPVRLPGRAPSAPSTPRPTGNAFSEFDSSAPPPPASAPATVQTMVKGGAPQVIGKPTGAMTIGRGLENDIVLKDLLASRRHARLVPMHGGYEVEDLGSRNGTYVNGSRISRSMLGEDDLLAIGRARFTVKHGRLVASEDDGNVSFVANHLSFTLPDGRKLLDDISFGLEGSSLVAVIGPSGAGKSTLLKALIGAQQATEGEVYYDGRDLYENYDDLRHRIGVVPQDDVVHPQLTVRQALRYAAELRFPDDLDKSLREQRVEEVIDELGLTDHATTQISRLSGGQRKRTSVALELLTRPSLLFLDEPTSGLDPGLDKRVMLTLRQLADGGRTVVVITHNVASLGVCDRVLLLAPGGKVAYFGPPENMLGFFDADDYADVFNAVTDDPHRAQATFTSSPHMAENVSGPLSSPRPTVDPVMDKPPRQQTIPRQLSTLVRRQGRVLLADRGFMGFMLALPVVLAALAYLVPGDGGLTTPAPGTTGPVLRAANAQTTQILVLLVMGAVFMGLASTIRELVAERPIFLREKAVGLSPFGYLMSKVIVYGFMLTVQCAIMIALVVAVRGRPGDALVLSDPVLEIFVACLLTGLAALAIGLVLSSLARTSEQVMPMLVIAIMAALVFSGGLFALDRAPELWAGGAFPSRWGLAMGMETTGAATDLRPQPGAQPPGTLISHDRFWTDPTRPRFLLAGAALLVQFLVAFVGAWALTRRRKSV